MTCPVALIATSIIIGIRNLHAPQTPERSGREAISPLRP
jgi:hypothetical protein